MTQSNHSVHALAQALLTLNSQAEMEQFLTDLCTPQELTTLADRWRVVAPIKAGVAYRTIYEQTGVSVTTIGRVARTIAHGEGGYELAFERVRKDTS